MAGNLWHDGALKSLPPPHPSLSLPLSLTLSFPLLAGGQSVQPPLPGDPLSHNASLSACQAGESLAN